MSVEIGSDLSFAQSPCLVSVLDLMATQDAATACAMCLVHPRFLCVIELLCSLKAQDFAERTGMMPRLGLSPGSPWRHALSLWLRCKLWLRANDKYVSTSNITGGIVEWKSCITPVSLGSGSSEGCNGTSLAPPNQGVRHVKFEAMPPAFTMPEALQTRSAPWDLRSVTLMIIARANGDCTICDGQLLDCSCTAQWPDVGSACTKTRFELAHGYPLLASQPVRPVCFTCSKNGVLSPDVAVRGKTISNGKWHVYTVVSCVCAAIDQTIVTLLVDGDQDASHTIAGTNPLVGLTLGSDRHGLWRMNGGVAEAVLWRGVLPPSSQSEIEKILVSRCAEKEVLMTDTIP